jgi:hypothetical protein
LIKTLDNFNKQYNALIYLRMSEAMHDPLFFFSFFLPELVWTNFLTSGECPAAHVCGGGERRELTHGASGGP